MRRIEGSELKALQPVIHLAESLTLSSPCQKSQRAAVVFNSLLETNPIILASAVNKPEDENCNTSYCPRICRFNATHAERAVLRKVISQFALEELSGASLLHIKRKNGRITPVSKVTCWDCSSYAYHLQQDLGIRFSEFITQTPQGYLAFSIAEWYELSLQNNQLYASS